MVLLSCCVFAKNLNEVLRGLMYGIMESGLLEHLSDRGVSGQVDLVDHAFKGGQLDVVQVGCRAKMVSGERDKPFDP